MRQTESLCRDQSHCVRRGSNQVFCRCRQSERILSLSSAGSLFHFGCFFPHTPEYQSGGIMPDPSPPIDHPLTSEEHKAQYSRQSSKNHQMQAIPRSDSKSAARKVLFDEDEAGVTLRESGGQTEKKNPLIAPNGEKGSSPLIHRSVSYKSLGATQSNPLSSGQSLSQNTTLTQSNTNPLPRTQPSAQSQIMGSHGVSPRPNPSQPSSGMKRVRSDVGLFNFFN